MILTRKVKHGKDLSNELAKAKIVANFAINNRDKRSSKDVKDIGLPAAISNQILRKYGKNKKCNTVKSVKLTLPSQSIKVWDNGIKIVPLGIMLEVIKDFEKVNQVELDDTYAYISVTVKEKEPFEPKTHIGVDLNATKHCAVVAIKETGKVYKLGKEAEHIHNKYRYIRSCLQKQGRYKEVKKIKNRESRIVRDINHKISRFIVNLAIANQSNINLEKLANIRKNKKHTKSFNHTLHSWSFYQLKTFIEYKAVLAGVNVSLINPAYTSQCCSHCGELGIRKGKEFMCPNCGHVEHADVNAAFNIALPSSMLVQLQEERDSCKGSTDTSHKATSTSKTTLRTPRL